MIGFDACENSFGPAAKVSYLKNIRSMDIPELCDLVACEGASGPSLGSAA